MDHVGVGNAAPGLVVLRDFDAERIGIVDDHSQIVRPRLVLGKITLGSGMVEAESGLSLDAWPGSAQHEISARKDAMMREGFSLFLCTTPSPLAHKWERGRGRGIRAKNVMEALIRNSAARFYDAAQSCNRIRKSLAIECEKL